MWSKPWLLKPYLLSNSKNVVHDPYDHSMISLTQRDNILGLLLQQGPAEWVTWHIYTGKKDRKASSPDDMLSGSIATTRRSGVLLKLLFSQPAQLRKQCR